MKKKLFALLVALTIMSSVTLTSCIGSFALTNKVHAWNKQVGSKWVNELVFVAFCILPVYPVSAVADMLVINSIEFWSGTNPVTTASTKVIDGKDAKYLVKNDQKGYEITNLTTNEVVRFDFDAADQSWSYNNGANSYKLMVMVDDSQVKMITPNGSFQEVELNPEGVWAYNQMATSALMASY